MGVKIVQIVLILLVLAPLCFAIPASDETFFLKQPDGRSIEVRQVGDERFYLLETADGYILQKDALGFYAYANEMGESSGIYARNAQDRSESDAQFLAGLNPEKIYERLYELAPKDDDAPENERPAFVNRGKLQMAAASTRLSVGKLRGLVLLVQYSDVKFKIANANQFFTDFFNKEGFDEFANHGSVRDYFVQNSIGLFTPEFDVYGPITVPGKRASYGYDSTGLAGGKRAVKEALDSLVKKGGIDFSQYDKDKDGYIDFIFMVYAGVGAATTSVKDAIWPHAGGLGDLGFPKNGMKLDDSIYANKYACSNEISGSAYQKDSSTSVVDGIGTAIHEFSHTLGLPDMYDSGKKNPRKTPGTWDVMDQGVYNCPTNSYNTRSCMPPFYSALERSVLGWLTPTDLNHVGTLVLEKIDNNVAYRVLNPKNVKDYFLLEYRSNKDWDGGQRASGMLIWHIDRIDSLWRKNRVNNDSNHMQVDIVEAVPEKVTYATADDPFPGAGNVTEFDKFIFRNGDDMKIALSNIKESSDKDYVTFTVNMTVKSSSSLTRSSSSVLSSSSMVSSSSATVSSSSIRASSSSNVPGSSSRIAEMSSSSAIASSCSAISSSESLESSSSEHPVFAVHSTPLSNVRVRMHNGDICIYAPQQGVKTVRFFSPIGTLLLETTMDGYEQKIVHIRQLATANVILSVSQGGKRLFTEMLKL